MPSAASRRICEEQLPCFMTVFGLDTVAMDDRDPVTVVDPKFMDPEAVKLPTESRPRLRNDQLRTDATHRHNDSASTHVTESAESSPTTDASSTDSSSLSDASPSSSPDSPITLMPLSSLTAASLGVLGGLSNLSMADSSNVERPMTSPVPRRPKNMKGLSIQPPFGSLSSPQGSEPSSPSFIKPVIPTMKRKPSVLSLKTQPSDLFTKTTLELPLSPGPILQRRALKHSNSSPHMLASLTSATNGPPGGMTVPTVLERNETGLSNILRPLKSPYDAVIREKDSPIKTQMANRALFDFEPFHESGNNEDSKTPGYPDGPIAIFGDNVYLFSEPNAEVASRFDVVINVAREVRNPFQETPQAEEGETAESHTPESGTSASTFATVLDTVAEDATAETPTTPKAGPPLKEPEYIHVPWDHNTDIAPDLMTLCETIERKTKEGKRVLIHCQQGASRSASLIIAYGMYQNPDLSVNGAYHKAQSKSKWISPNMRLMYCLQDFQKEVVKRRLSPGFAFRAGRSMRSPTKHRATLSADDAVRTKEPSTAPLPAEDMPPVVGNAGPERSPNRIRADSTPIYRELGSPGPSSAPSSFSWSDKGDDRDPGSFAPDVPLKQSGLFSPTKLSFGSLDTMYLPPATPVHLSPCFPPKLHSPRFGSFDPSFASLDSLAQPPPSPGFLPPSWGSLPKPPPSPGFPPLSFGPRFMPPPPASFADHRVGKSSDVAGMPPLNLSGLGIRHPRGMQRRPVSTLLRSLPDDPTLMSPRAETMTKNPLHADGSAFGSRTDVLASAGLAGLTFVEIPPTPDEGLFSPRQTLFPPRYPSQTADPRSPPTKGETPIVRSIDEIL